MTFSIFKNQTIKSEKIPYRLFTEVDKLNSSDNVDYNLVMTIEETEPLLLKFRNTKPEIQYANPKDFSTTLFLRFTTYKDQMTFALSVKPNPLFLFLYIVIAVLMLVTVFVSRSVESLLGILAMAIMAFAWDRYSRLSIKRRVNDILAQVKY